MTDYTTPPPPSQPPAPPPPPPPPPHGPHYQGHPVHPGQPGQPHADMSLAYQKVRIPAVLMICAGIFMVLSTFLGAYLSTPEMQEKMALALLETCKKEWGKAVNNRREVERIAVFLDKRDKFEGYLNR